MVCAKSRTRSEANTRKNKARVYRLVLGIFHDTSLECGNIGRR